LARNGITLVVAVKIPQNSAQHPGAACRQARRGGGLDLVADGYSARADEGNKSQVLNGAFYLQWNDVFTN
jgi:hypothetical protein